MFENKVMETDFPGNLFYDITGIKLEEMENMPLDAKPTMLYLMYQELPEGMADIVLSRYSDGYSYRKIGSLYGISGQRAEQIVSYSLNLLKGHTELLTRGIMVSLREVSEDYAEKTRKEIEEESREAFEKVGYLAGFSDAKEGTENVYEDAPVASLNLSTRNYNALKRLHMEKISDIIAFGDRISDVHALGKKSYDELMTCLKNRGVNVKKVFPKTIYTNHLEV